MIRKILFLLIFISVSLMASETNRSILIVNMENLSELPNKFRKSIDSIRASGSSQFSENSLKIILDLLPQGQVTIVDLREESHGFINGIAVSWWIDRNWGNIGKSLAEIQKDEKQNLIKASKLDTDGDREQRDDGQHRMDAARGDDHPG